MYNDVYNFIYTIPFVFLLLFKTTNAQDTIVVIGNDPKYYVENLNFALGTLKEKLPQGTYAFYYLKKKYRGKVSVDDTYDNMNKYQGSLSSLISYNSDSLKDGISYLYHYDVVKAKNVCVGILNYSKGKLNGMSVEYYKDGAIRSVGIYTENKETGTWYYFGNKLGEVSKRVY